jgi:hypothetical protein
MTYQITLTDEEYAVLAAAAEAQGESVEALVHTALVSAFPPTTQATYRVDPLAEYMYKKGRLLSLPDGKPDTPEGEAELEELANSVLPRKPASEIVIEDRGPR